MSRLCSLGWLLLWAPCLGGCGETDSADGAGASTGTETTSGPSSTSSGAAGGGTSSGAGGANGVWTPAPGTTWQWQLGGYPVDTEVDATMFDIDLFDAPDEVFVALKAKSRIVICYVNVGAWEPYREDAGDFPEAVKGSVYEGFEDERWLDIRSETVRNLMTKRLDVAVSRGCDGIEPDNIHGFVNDTGFPLTAGDQLDYNLWLAGQAHDRKLSIGLKNDLEQASELVDAYDWALNEECAAFDECDVYAQTFIAKGKAVFHVEYTDGSEPVSEAMFASTVCPATKALGMSSLLKHLDLDAYRISCP